MIKRHTLLAAVAAISFSAAFTPAFAQNPMVGGAAMMDNKNIVAALPGIEWVILGDHRAGSMQVRTLRRRYSSLRNP